MPSSGDAKRNNKNKTQRTEELIKSAKGPQDVVSWSQYFGKKLSPVTSTLGGMVSVSGSVKHGALHTFAKVVVIGGTGTFLALFTGPILGSIVAGGAYVMNWMGIKDQLVDYGSAVIEDWIKAGGELLISGGQYVQESLSTPPTLSSTEQAKAGLEAQTADLLASVGMLATLMRESELLQNAACAYCDDAYARARVIERVEQEMVKVKGKVDTLKTKLDDIKVFVDGTLTTDIGRRKTQVKQTITDTVSATNPRHFDDSTIFTRNTLNPLYRTSHCSQVHCYGPGTSGTD